MPTFRAQFLPRPLNHIWNWYLDNKLLVFTICGVIVGVSLGIGLQPYKLSDKWVLFLGFPGDIFLRGLQLLIVPIIFASLVAGAATLNAKASGKMAIKAIAYFLCTSMMCATIGLGFVLAIRPGSTDIGNQLREEASSKSNPQVQDIQALDTILDMFRNAFPDNIVMATMQQVYTDYEVKQKRLYFHDKTDNKSENASLSMRGDNATKTVHSDYEVKQNLLYFREKTDNKTENASLSMQGENATETVLVLKTRNQMNAMGLIVFCMAFGTVLGSLGDKGSLMVGFFEQLDICVSRLVRIFMWCTPIGVASLICKRLILTGDLSSLASNLGWYMLTVMLSLVTHQFIMLPSIYFIVLRKNPFRFSWNLAQAWLTAFALSSSVATLPVSFRCMDEKNKVDVRVLRFVLPVGATINMDGTAMFVIIAAIFLAQISGIATTAANCAVLILMATCLSIGAAAVPSASLFLLTMLTSILKVPTSDIALLFTVDWLLDRLRTTSNIISDCYAAAVVEKLSSKDLEEADAIYQAQELEVIPEESEKEI